MLQESQLTPEQLKTIIQPHQHFLDLVEEKEQIDWTDSLLLRDFPNLYNLRLIVHTNINAVSKESKEYATIYSLSSARTFLTIRFLLPFIKKSPVIDKETINHYTNFSVNRLYTGLQKQYPHSLENAERARKDFYAHGAIPDGLLKWLTDFMGGNEEFSDLFLLPSNSYPSEAVNYMYRGIADIACPMSLRLENLTMEKRSNPLPTKV